MSNSYRPIIISSKQVQRMNSQRGFLGLGEQFNSYQHISYSTQFQTDIQKSELLKVVGLLRVNWFNKLGKLVCVNYGTAFAVNSKMVVTCIHNIYSENGRELCQEVTFIPGIAKGFINDSHHQYKCTEAARMKCQIPKETLSYTPLKEELVILALDDGFQIEANQFITLGSLEDNYEGRQLNIVGYPSFSYSRNVKLGEVSAQREILNGNLHSLEKHVLNHTMKTNVGQSGSPILAQDGNGSFYAVGIHTHRGTKPTFNSGLYFNTERLNKLYQYEKELQKFCKLKPKSIFHSKFQPTTDVLRILPPDEYFQTKEVIDIDNRDCLEKSIQLYEEYLVDYQEFFIQIEIQISNSLRHSSKSKVNHGETEETSNFVPYCSTKNDQNDQNDQKCLGFKSFPYEQSDDFQNDQSQNSSLVFQKQESQNSTEQSDVSKSDISLFNLKDLMDELEEEERSLMILDHENQNESKQTLDSNIDQQENLTN